MKYLLDTHILIWLCVSPEKVPKPIMRMLENPENALCVSTVSLWEIAIKLSVGKLNLRGIDLPDIAEMCAEQGIEIVQFPVSAALQYRKLPLKENHKDPFDRALIRAEGFIPRRLRRNKGDETRLRYLIRTTYPDACVGVC